MNTAKKVFCRTYQTAFRLALPVLPYREPQLHDSTAKLADVLKKQGRTSVLLITDRFLHTSGVTTPLEVMLSSQHIQCTVYDGTSPNPTVKNVEEAVQLYHENNCDCLIALGGGSAMDCAKGAGARIAYPNKTLGQLSGLLRVIKKLPLLIAIPTTAGTGSEATLAAVITDSEKKYKYTINSFPLIPAHAVLDPAYTLSLPPHLTAATGMDTLTHAVEAYIGRSTTRRTRALCLEAVQLVFENIETAYREGHNWTARTRMLRASYAAGVAFTRSYVGYVHAVAHSLGGQYNFPHGQTNATLLPYVLEAYSDKVHKKLHTLAVAAGVAKESDAPADAARAFITAIRQMNERMNIPAKLAGIRREDIPLMAAHADKEANPLYPVPVLMDKQALEQFYYQVADWS